MAGEEVLLALHELVFRMWGGKSIRVVHEYQQAFDGRPLLERDLAVFCGIASANRGASDFDRGVAEGMRRVFLHIERMRRLTGRDFVALTDGDREHD